MASLQQQLNAIINKIQNTYVPSAMKKEVSQESKTVMQIATVEKVYNAYEPTHYNRQFDDGGLLDRDNIETTLIGNNTLKVENIRRDEETGRLVTPIIESGKGYYTQELDDRIGARMFVEETAKELEKGKAKEALKRGLLRQGLNVK